MSKVRFVSGSRKSSGVRIDWLPHSLPLGKTMPGRTEQSKRYLRLAAESEKLAAEPENSELKGKLLEIADEYRGLALQIDDPETWAKLLPCGVEKTLPADLDKTA